VVAVVQYQVVLQKLVALAAAVQVVQEELELTAQQILALVVAQEFQVENQVLVVQVLLSLGTNFNRS
jgi:hypothetical protein